MATPVRQIRETPPRAAAPRGGQPLPAPAPSPGANEARWWQPTPARVGFTLAALLIYLGFKLPLARWLSPEHGLGYALGIIGGSAMLLLLIYPARKHWAWLASIGSVKRWFQIHMVLGVVGPLCILYHSTFSLGATNSNAALFAMLVV